MLDPNGETNVVHIDDIDEVIVNGQEFGTGGYLDIGLKDTMKGGLFVNFIGAVVFSIIGYFYVETRGARENLRGNLSRNESRRREII